MMKEGQSQSQVVNERDLLYGFVSDFLTGRLLQGSLLVYKQVNYLGQATSFLIYKVVYLLRKKHTENASLRLPLKAASLPTSLNKPLHPTLILFFQ